MAFPSTKDTAPQPIWKRFGFTALVATIVARFSPLLNSPCRLTEPDGTARDAQWLGDFGERVAAAWLVANRCKVLARNYRANRYGRRGGEVDIVARRGRLLLFVEVKTRRDQPLVRPFWAVDKDKQRLIERGANDWLKRLGTRNIPWRFDVIEVYVRDGHPPKVVWIENAF
jgi:putative endonuclease